MTSFVTLTMDLLFRCNYMATLQGLIANKMLVDSIFALPDLIPYWIKCIAFFFVTLPVNMFTLFDDALGAFIMY